MTLTNSPDAYKQTIETGACFQSAAERATEDDEPLDTILCRGFVIECHFFEKLDMAYSLLEHCKFEECDFTRASFYDTQFRNCDFTNCIFSDSYWQRCQWIDCRFNGANFNHASLKKLTASNTPMRYANFSKALMEDTMLTGCDCSDTGMTEIQLRRVTWKKITLCRADLFKTKLKGMDLSTCDIGGILLSDGSPELRGAIISQAQALDIVRRLGVTIA